jgi:CheY-like chemotaxis protein
MDHMMRTMNGVTATETLRKKGYTKPIIILTANALVGAREKFMEQGFDEFLSKPIDARELDRLLHVFIKNEITSDLLEQTPISIKPDLLARLEKDLAYDMGECLTQIEELNSRWSELTPNEFDRLIVIVHGVRGAVANFGYEKLMVLSSRIQDELEKQTYDCVREDMSLLVAGLRALKAKLE